MHTAFAFAPYRPEHAILPIRVDLISLVACNSLRIFRACCLHVPASLGFLIIHAAPSIKASFIWYAPRYVFGGFDTAE